VDDRQRIRDYVAKIRQMGAKPRFGERDRLGTANLIDAEARRRGARAVVDGTPLSLARPMVPHTANSGRPGYALSTFFEHTGKSMAGMDHVELDPHGYINTHLDGLNHIGLDDTWYSGWPEEDHAEVSMAELARHGLVTRGVVADIPAARGVESVTVDEPVTADDLERALKNAGLTIEPGDALLLYMGRDRFEGTGRRLPGDFALDASMPGVGSNGAEWLADHPISMLAWDFLDTVHPSEPVFSVHYLIWAMGLLLIDNCDYSRAIPELRRLGRYEGQFFIAPLALEGATGANVNPWLIV
jgi:kynurenine formamidase